MTKKFNKIGPWSLPQGAAPSVALTSRCPNSRRPLAASTVTSPPASPAIPNGRARTPSRVGSQKGKSDAALRSVEATRRSAPSAERPNRVPSTPRPTKACTGRCCAHLARHAKQLGPGNGSRTTLSAHRRTSGDTVFSDMGYQLKNTTPCSLRRTAPAPSVKSRRRPLVKESSYSSLSTTATHPDESGGFYVSGATEQSDYLEMTSVC